jgi:hypothetical protein
MRRIALSTATGIATCDTTFAVPGPTAVEAAYSGDADFAASLSQSLPEIVDSSLQLRRVRSTRSADFPSGSGLPPCRTT